MLLSSHRPGGFGAVEISELDCSAKLERETILTLKAAYLEHSIIVVRDQELTARDFVRFANIFGPLEGTRISSQQEAYARDFRPRSVEDSMLYVHPEEPAVHVMSSVLREDLVAIGVVDAAGSWHSDASHTLQPTQGIALYARLTSSTGGETEFCNMALLYEALPAELKDRLDGKWATHHWSKAMNPRMAGTFDAADLAEYREVERLVPPSRHPIVRTHPETGRRSVFISPRFTIAIEGLSEDESDALLGTLYALIEDPRFYYRHTWRDGDVMVWDNRCLIHRASGGYAAGDVREMYRATVSGDAPFFRVG